MQRRHLPRAVRGAFAGDLFAAAVHVDDAGLGLVGRHQAVIGDRHPGITRLGEGILGKLLEVAGVHQFLQRLRRFLLIERVLVNDRAQGVQVFTQRRFLGVQNGLRIIAAWRATAG